MPVFESFVFCIFANIGLKAKMKTIDNTQNIVIKTGIFEIINDKAAQTKAASAKLRKNNEGIKISSKTNIIPIPKII